MALRLSAQRAARLEQHQAGTDDVRQLATVRALFAEGTPGPDTESSAADMPAGDDDTEAELEASDSEETTATPVGHVSDEEFYADAFANVE
jgi:hypothetical protein